MAYTTIDDPSAYFQVKTYTGTSGIHDVTLDGNSDMQPDLVWFKNRTVGYTHQLYDSSRGVTKALYPQGNNAEVTISNGLTRFDPNGFRVSSAAAINEDEIVCWNWHANAGTTSTNNDGNHTSVVQANQDAGFSIVTYTGTGNTSSTVGHGLGVTPNWIIFKRRSGTANWDVQIDGTSRNTLNLTEASATNVLSSFSSTTFGLGSVTSNEKNANGSTYVAYCFAEKQGFSRFSSYVGNGSTNGTFVYTGFKPAFVMIKRSDGVTNWRLFDSKRSGFNGDTSQLYPNLANAEDAAGDQIDLLSNGFKNRTVSGDQNISGASYIYMAFAENPFTTSTGIPTTAR